jgi:hypothetical protein
MKKQQLIVILLLALASGINQAGAQGTAFTYQGVLTDSGGPLNGPFSLTFKLYDDAISGHQLPVGSPISITKSVNANGGLVTASLDFGSSAFTGGGRWLEITVGANPPLSPRQELTPTPYALFAEGVANGAITASQLYTPQGGPSSGQFLTYNSSGNLNWTSLNSAGGLTLPYSGTLSISGPLFTLDNTGSGPAAVFLGSVGIHTTNPQSDLDVNGQFGVFGSGLDGSVYQRFVLYADTTHGLAFQAPRDSGQNNLPYHFTWRGGTDAMTILGNGNVGIGTPSPGGTLSLYNSASDLIFKLEDRRTAGSGDFLSKQAFYDYGGEAAYVGLRHNQFLGNGPRALAFGLSGSEKARITNDGKVGIGTTNPSGALHVASGGVAVTGQSSPYLGAGQGLFMEFAGGTGSVYAYDYSANGPLPLRLNAPGGTVSVPVLQITGGSDLAEPFLLTGEGIAKGSLVIIDEANTGRLKRSEHAYDTRVAGIVSGANGIKAGISLQQDGTLAGGENVALSGRVYALADASYGPIRPGDLLTTSNTPGHCMKVTDHARAQGAVIGKAMSSLTEGKGMVLVLVSLE